MALWVDCACVLLAVDYLKQFVVLFFISTKQFGKFTVCQRADAEDFRQQRYSDIRVWYSLVNVRLSE